MAPKGERAPIWSSIAMLPHHPAYSSTESTSVPGFGFSVQFLGCMYCGEHGVSGLVLEGGERLHHLLTSRP